MVLNADRFSLIFLRQLVTPHFLLYRLLFRDYFVIFVISLCPCIVLFYAYEIFCLLNSSNKKEKL